MSVTLSKHNSGWMIQYFRDGKEIGCFWQPTLSEALEAIEYWFRE